MNLDEALDALDGAGTARVPQGNGCAEIDVVDADRLGVRVTRVRVDRETRDIRAEAQALPNRLRALPERVHASEVAPELGGAILRTLPEEMNGRYFEVKVEADSTEITRIGVVQGERQPEDFVVTREQLKHLIDQLG